MPKHRTAIQKRLQDVRNVLQEIAELVIDEEIQVFSEKLIAKGGIPEVAKADALHIAVASAHGMVYLPTWNCRHTTMPPENPSSAQSARHLGIHTLKSARLWNLLPEYDDDVS